MKNLIDELHELDNCEYKVSKDFSKRVMKTIKKEKNKSKFDYAISIATVGVAACIAVILFNNSNFRSSIFDFSKGITESNNMDSVSINNGYYDSIEGISDNSDKMFSDNINDGIFATEADNSIVDNLASDVNSYEADEYISESDVGDRKEFANQLAGNAFEEKQESTNNVVENTILRKDSDYKEIEKILRKAGLIVEVTDNEIKVKSTKDKIENLLKDYDNLIIEINGDYVIIKF